MPRARRILAGPWRPQAGRREFDHGATPPRRAPARGRPAG
jgi:hypothetical protein